VPLEAEELAGTGPARTATMKRASKRLSASAAALKKSATCSRESVVLSFFGPRGGGSASRATL